jgi:hypothetical protein
MPEHPFLRYRSAWIEKKTEMARMTEQERHEPLPEVDRADAEVRETGGGPRPAHEDAVTPTDQAVSNQEQALESGEENVV